MSLCPRGAIWVGLLVLVGGLALLGKNKYAGIAGIVLGIALILCGT